MKYIDIEVQGTNTTVPDDKTVDTIITLPGEKLVGLRLRFLSGSDRRAFASVAGKETPHGAGWFKEKTVVVIEKGCNIREM